jgi:hypothetical protein
MTSLTVELSESTFQFLAEQATSQGFRSPADYLTALANQAEAEREAIEEELQKGLDGPARELTKQDWDSLRQRVWERHEANRQP